MNVLKKIKNNIARVIEITTAIPPPSVTIGLLYLFKSRPAIVFLLAISIQNLVISKLTTREKTNTIMTMNISKAGIFYC